MMITPHYHLYHIFSAPMYMHVCCTDILMKVGTINYNLFYYTVKGKGEDHTRTGHDGPEGEERYRSTLPLTSALDGGGWPMPCPM